MPGGTAITCLFTIFAERAQHLGVVGLSILSV